MSAAALLAIILASASPARGEGTTAAEFLRFGVGRPTGMSGAGGAIQQGAEAAYWNPAGLAALDAADAYLYHNRLPETVSFSFLGAAYPVKRGVLAYSLQLLSQGDQTKLDNNGASQGSFSASDMAHALAFAGAVGGWRAGASVRFIQQRIDETSGDTAALDLGLQRERGPWLMGAAVSNLGPELKLSGEHFPLPLTGRIGAGRRLWGKRFFLAADAVSSRGKGEGLSLGAELRPSELARVRAGYTIAEREKDGPSGLAFGATLSQGPLRFDLAFAPFGKLGSSLQFGLDWNFGERKGCCQEPRDGDGDADGVLDRLDACPNSPAGLAVDERGCPTSTPAPAPAETPAPVPPPAKPGP